MSNYDTIDHIDHKAIVVSSDPERNLVNVRIDDSGECGTCPAAALCGVNGTSSNTISIYTKKAGKYKKHDIVTVRGTEKMHRKAIMYATVLPSIAMMAVMVAVYVTTLNQLAAALAGIGTMLLFFILLWAARNKVAHEFSFSIVESPEHAADEY